MKYERIPVKGEMVSPFGPSYLLLLFCWFSEASPQPQKKGDPPEFCCKRKIKDLLCILDSIVGLENLYNYTLVYRVEIQIYSLLLRV